MKIGNIKIHNFRGIKESNIVIENNCVFVGDNNSGKSTILEAIDLVMGPDRLSRHPVINEHDFFAGEYIQNDVSIEIFIEIILTHLTKDQKRHFNNYIEWWDASQKSLISDPPASNTDGESVVPALRVCFKGMYDFEEDDFCGQTYFSSTLRYEGSPAIFSKKDKRICGFLYLRTLRTGNRALSLERGSLLDIILQLREMRPQMWEKILSQLKGVSIAAEPEIGISEILSTIQNSLSSVVSSESANNPQIRVSNLTREHLRKILTVFMDSGSTNSLGAEYTNPYFYQGTGTINILVLSLLTMIAELKQNVIFAMEEPEIALPPHIQKRVILSVFSKSTQALFTSHSPYVLEEFEPNNILVVSRINGVLKTIPAGIPPSIKLKQYRDEFRKRFCESLLARRVLITEGRTEFDVYSNVARKLQNSSPEKQLSFDLLGIAMVNAETDSQIAELGQYYRQFNKEVFAIFDKQTPANKANIEQAVNYAYEAPEDGIENLVLNHISPNVLKEYGFSLVISKEWPQHLSSKIPTDKMSNDEMRSALLEYFKWSKGKGTLADMLISCQESDLPSFIVSTINDISSKACYDKKFRCV